MHRYFEEINGNKYLTLVPINESKKKKKKRDLMRSIIKSLDDYCEKKLKNFYDENDYDFTIMMKNM